MHFGYDRNQINTHLWQSHLPIRNCLKHQFKRDLSGAIPRPSQWPSWIVGDAAIACRQRGGQTPDGSGYNQCDVSAKSAGGEGVNPREAQASRWAGVSPSERRAERRRLLIGAGFELFGEGGEAAVSVRSVCGRAGLNSRYFYESFTDTNELLGAVYDEVVNELGKVLYAATVAIPDDHRARLRAGIRAVLEFTSADPRRGEVLFVGAGVNPVFAVRRAAAKNYLRNLVLTDRQRNHPRPHPMSNEVEAAIYVGAMSEMAREWAIGALGDDLDLVVDAAMQLLTPPGD